MKHNTLVAAFQNVNGASFVGIDTLTDVKLKGGKGNPHQGRITKRTIGAQVMCFQNKNTNGYEAMVQRRLTAEGKDPASFELGERAWGVRVPNMPIVEHFKDGVNNYYLEVVVLNSGKTVYLLDGILISKSDIIGFNEVGTTADSQGGLENKVIIRSFKADSITQVRIDGTVYN
jgi:hypothetical protein